MLDEKDLQAIRAIVKEETAAVEARLDQKLAGVEARMDQKLAATEARLDQKIAGAQSEIMRGVAVLMEAKFDPQFNLLAEGQRAIREQLPSQEDWDIVDTRISALEAMVKKLNREVAQLKKAQ